MDSHISLSVFDGEHEIVSFNLSGGRRFIVGRSQDCDIVLRGEAAASLSRHHCLLAVDPPAVSVRDLGSRNGTYVNGECIGFRLDENPLDSEQPDDYVSYELDDGDEIRIGQTVLRIAIGGFAQATDSPLMRSSGHVHSTV